MTRPLGTDHSCPCATACRGNRSRGLSRFSRRKPRKWDCPLWPKGDRHIFRPCTGRKMSQSPACETLLLRSSGTLPARGRGFTLLEVMIAVVLSMILMAGLWGLFSTYESLFSQGQAKVENAQLLRALFEQISQDLKSAIPDSSAGLPGQSASRRFGLFGTQSALQVDVLRINDSQMLLVSTRPEESTEQERPARVPELHTVQYLFGQADESEEAAGGSLAGLVRRELGWDMPAGGRPASGRGFPGQGVSSRSVSADPMDISAASGPRGRRAGVSLLRRHRLGRSVEQPDAKVPARGGRSDLDPETAPRRPAGRKTGRESFFALDRLGGRSGRRRKLSDPFAFACLGGERVLAVVGRGIRTRGHAEASAAGVLARHAFGTRFRQPFPGAAARLGVAGRAADPGVSGAGALLSAARSLVADWLARRFAAVRPARPVDEGRAMNRSARHTHRALPRIGCRKKIGVSDPTKPRPLVAPEPLTTAARRGGATAAHRGGATTGRGFVRRRGMVLIIVVVVVVMLSLAGLSFVANMQTENKAAHVQGRRLQLDHVVGSGAECLKAFCRQSWVDQQEAGGSWDNPDRFRGVLVVEGEAAGRRARFSIVSPKGDEGEATGSRFGVENESAKLNLGSLLRWEQREPESARRALMGLPGMTPSIADAILDWIDPDSTPRALGAENDYYRELEVPYGPRNGLPQCPEELLLVRGVTRELLFGADGGSSPLTGPAAGSAASARARSGLGASGPPLASLLTACSAERNETLKGQRRIYLNGANLSTLHQPLAAALDRPWADFIVLYRQFGPYRGPRPADATTPTVDLGRPAKVNIASILDLIDAKVQVGTGDRRNAPIVASPLAADSADLREKLPLLLDAATVVTAQVIEGKINVNLAPRAVLMAVPGMDDALADRILVARGSRGPRDDAQHRFPTWLLTEGLVDLPKMKALLPYLTGGGDVVRGQILGYYDERGPTTRRTWARSAAATPWRPWGRSAGSCRASQFLRAPSGADRAVATPSVCSPDAELRVSRKGSEAQNVGT